MKYNRPKLNDAQIKKLKRRREFNPSRAYVANAVEEYLRGGGKITRITFDHEAYVKFLEAEKGRLEADQYLRGM